MTEILSRPLEELPPKNRLLLLGQIAELAVPDHIVDVWIDLAQTASEVDDQKMLRRAATEATQLVMTSDEALQMAWAIRTVNVDALRRILTAHLDDDMFLASACALMSTEGRRNEALVYADLRVSFLAHAAGPRRAAALRQRARVHLDLGEPKEQEKDLREAARIDPGDAEGMKSFAELLFERGEESEARSVLDKALALAARANKEPEYLLASDRLIPLLLRTGRLSEALGVADRRVAASGKTDPLALSTALAERGMIEARLKAYPKSERDFVRALSLIPASPELALSVARVLYRGGRPERALPCSSTVPSR